MAEIYGDVGKSPVFVAAFTRSLNAIWKSGTVAAVKSYLSGSVA
jgi:mannitol 2-dehydrogenase